MNTKRGKLEVLDNPLTVARAAAEQFAAAASRVLGDHERFTVALAGGSTPRAMYEILATSFRDRIEWSRIDIFFGDERCVPPDHKDSNYRMAREALLDHVPLGADRVHRMAGERDPAEAARAYEQIVRRVLGTSHEPPRLDLVLLGMGPDGHTASLFPGTKALEEKHRLVVENFVPKLDAWRITMTAPLLSAAAEVIVITAGEEKAEALALALEAPEGTVPIQLVRPVSGQMTWIVDRAAASKLRL